MASNFTASLDVDQRMYREDIAGSIAHSRMLARQGIISQTDADRIVGGLQQIESEIESGEFVWKEELEDIHMNVESRLFELIGDAAGRLHTGRSRNDQVATDSRMYAKRAAADAVRAVRLTQRALLKQAANHVDTVLPGYTHLQRGQPVSLAHHLLAYFEMLDRDAGGSQRRGMLPTYCRSAAAPWLASRIRSTANRWPPNSVFRPSAQTAWTPCLTATTCSISCRPPQSA